MKVDRHVLLLCLGVPALLVTLSMLARTELFIGDRIRGAVTARAERLGADVEIVTVGPSGLWSVELEHVSARVPRGEFAVEVAFDSVVVTPTLGSLFGGEVELDAVEVSNGAAAIVPWRVEERPKSSAPKRESRTRAPAKKRAQPKPTAPIDITLRNVEITAFSDRYQALPLQLARLEFDWRRGAPIENLAGYGSLPDGVEFSIVAEEGIYRLRPQRPTRVDRWVAPRGGGVGWPVALSTRDIRICVDCESVLALEDVVLSVPRWRDDVQLSAPFADVLRRGKEIGLSAPEMAIVDTTTREFSARLTETDFRYALDTGRLSGRVELADRSAGLLDVRWTWDAEDFDLGFEASNFSLAAIWHLVGLGDFVRPNRMDGTADITWDVRHQTIGLDADLGLDKLAVHVPWTSEAFDLRAGRFELDAFFDVRGRAATIYRAALTLEESAPMEFSASAVHAGKGVSFDLEFQLVSQPAKTLIGGLPSQWTTVLAGSELNGDVGLMIGATGHSGFPESLQLRGSIESDVEVVKEGREADVTKIGRSGPPPGFSGDWTPISDIPTRVWEIVLAAEDAGFFNHDGFSWGGIERAMVHNLRVGRPERGGSTITQQVVKNLFLDGDRTLSRKIQEAYLTWRLESVVPKRRILEIYLNIADWGPRTRGLDGAARHFFDVPPRDLQPIEVAMLAAILPNPSRFGGWIDEGYLATSRLEKIEHILNNLRYLKKITPEDYRRLWAEARSGKIGRLQLGICSDDDEKAPVRCGTL